MMGGKGSGRKFRWKAEIIPKLDSYILDSVQDYLLIEDSPEKLLEALRRLEHSHWYSAKKVILQRSRGTREEEEYKLIQKVFPELKNRKENTEYIR